MKVRVKLILALVCTVVMGFSLSPAEDLHIVMSRSLDVNEIASIDGVDVYAILEDAVLVGTTAGGLATLMQDDHRPEIVESIGKREKGCDYYFFRISEWDIGKLAPDIEVLYYNGKEAIARIEGGSGFDTFYLGLVRGLVHIPFVPRTHIEPKEAGQPR